MSEPAHTNMFIAADSELAEVLCHVELLALTVHRAKQLHRIHRDHPHDDCRVIAATTLQMP
ncbi:hypothetical protein HLB23_14325 [Nocardia uniformis]|uniref:Uncharacterized protein n=1 Tax=Nocardia uniformis TaxID=53432 RepID=A0A849C0P3_9NOCA|nr:hypothetical protein [Nocardia uniformis]NNH71026.1 hypothetical protein [Nocardia uniformis]